MLPNGLNPLIILLGVLALFGAAVGSISGVLIGQALRLAVRGVFKDALLGAIGSVSGFVGCALVPWPQNTVTTRLADHRVIQVTMNRFQHPEAVAFALAIVLPGLRQIYRYLRVKSVPGKAGFAIK